MTVGRGPVAHLIADVAELTLDDRVIDLGCGAGTVARVAVRGRHHVGRHRQAI